MGVKGLWQLLLPIGRRISIETLEGQVLAIDASIWLTQFLKAMRDPDTGQALPAAHLQGFLKRLCKLYYHGIRPVVVFDGDTPEIKKMETKRRRHRREEYLQTSDADIQRQAKRLLQKTLLQKKASDVKNKKDHDQYLDAKDQADRNKGSRKRGFLESFNPGDQEPDDEDVNQPCEEESDDDKSNNPSNQPYGSKDLNPEDRAAIQAILDQDEREQQEERVNDWELAAQQQAMEFQRDEQNTSSDEHEDTIEYEDYNLSQMDRIALLAPDKRKDAIESTLRQQRIRTRKELMPRAGNMEDFSKMQLAQYLKASKINQKIVSMVEKDKDAHHTMASNRAVRVTLERDDDSPCTKASHCNSWINQATEETSSRKGRLRQGDDDDIWAAPHPWSARIPTQPSHEDERGEVEESDSNSDAHSGAIPVENQRHSLIVLEDSSSDEDIFTGFLNTETCPKEKTAAPDLHTSFEGKHGDSGVICRFDNTIGATNIAFQYECVAATHDGPHGNDDEDMSGESDNVPWEDCDGEEQVSGEPNTVPLQPKSKNSMEYSPTGNDDDQFSITNYDDKQNNWAPKLDSIWSSEGSEDQKLARAAADQEAAVKRAEMIASSLTNWGGRVFRNEMKRLVKNELSPGVIATSASTDFTVGAEASPEASTKEESITNTLDPPLAKHRPRSNDTRTESTLKMSPYFNGPIGDPEGFDLVQPSTSSEPLPKEALFMNDFAVSDATRQILELNEEDWRSDRNRKQRDAETVTDEMRDEAIKLLELFGVPYIIAPTEAESQCATLEELGLVDGIVTEDSDIFVFGGQKVYKNFFNERQYAEAYFAADAKYEMTIGRNEFVALAMLLGCDYTDGVKGCGIVNSMEVLRAFDVSVDLEKGLLDLMKWMGGFDSKAWEKPPSAEDLEGMSPREKFEVKHRSARSKWVAPPNFPSQSVMHAFLSPVVDRSDTRFSWGKPDVEQLVVFCAKNIGWSPDETNTILKPVLERLNNRSRQTRLDAYWYMSKKDNIKFANVRSKRLRAVLDEVPLKHTEQKQDNADVK